MIFVLDRLFATATVILVMLLGMFDWRVVVRRG